MITKIVVEGSYTYQRLGAYGLGIGNTFIDTTGTVIAIILESYRVVRMVKGGAVCVTTVGDCTDLFRRCDLTIHVSDL